MFPSAVMTLFTKGDYGYVIINNMLQFPLYKIFIISVKHGQAEGVLLLHYCYALN